MKEKASIYTEVILDNGRGLMVGTFEIVYKEERKWSNKEIINKTVKDDLKIDISAKESIQMSFLANVNIESAQGYQHTVSSEINRNTQYENEFSISEERRLSVTLIKGQPTQIYQICFSSDSILYKTHGWTDHVISEIGEIKFDVKYNESIFTGLYRLMRELDGRYKAWRNFIDRLGGKSNKKKFKSILDSFISVSSEDSSGPEQAKWDDLKNFSINTKKDIKHTKWWLGLIQLMEKIVSVDFNETQGNWKRLQNYCKNYVDI